PGGDQLLEPRRPQTTEVRWRTVQRQHDPIARVDPGPVVVARCGSADPVPDEGDLTRDALTERATVRRPVAPDLERRAAHRPKDPALRPRARARPPAEGPSPPPRARRARPRTIERTTRARRLDGARPPPANRLS